MRQLVISAFGIHTGGALVLLDALVEAAAGEIHTLFVDARVQSRFMHLHRDVRIVPVAVSVAARVAALVQIARCAGPRDRLLCFNNLPPLTRSPAHTITYVHTPHLTGFDPEIAVPARERARFAFERALFRLGQRNSDALWVQTPTAMRGLMHAGVDAPIRLVPFDQSADRSIVGAGLSKANTANARFLYPASGAPHKNHVRLFEAWRLLDDEGLRPVLELTLIDPHAYHFRRCQAGLTDDELPHIVHLGEVSRGQVLARIVAADALIFPSLAETLGLPLLEATAAGTPIVAAERDFVRDVCLPAHTFDPTSPRSIADAVRRHLGSPRAPLAPMTPVAFLDAVFA